MSKDSYLNRRRFLATSAMTMLATQLGMIGRAQGHPARAGRLSVEGEMPPLAGATGWLNSEPLTTAALRGKVVVIDFWTYTCVNWRRTLPYVRAWALKYKDMGLVVVGVHTPEFSFEKEPANVRWALKDMRIDYPVATDNNYAIWSAFNNEYWPALYFVDAKGHIRHHQFGEGDYEQSEIVIQQLLAEAGAEGIDRGLATVTPLGAEVAADWGSLRSPESYVNYDHTESLTSSSSAAWNRSRVYAVPARLALNHWALSGDWTFGKEAVLLNRPNGRIAYCFHARDLNLVMGPHTQGTTVRFRVFIDGEPPGVAHGADVDAQGNGTMVEPRLYQLVRQPQPPVDTRFEIEFLDSGLLGFDFTFG